MKKTEKEESKPPKENSNQCQLDVSKFRIYTEEIKNKNLNSPEMLTASVSNCIHPEDSIIYNPKNINILPTKYPVYPLNLKPELMEKFNEDTLFYIFFIQQDPQLRHIVNKILQKRGWMYNNKFNTFFQLQGSSKNQTPEFIEGKFKYFDHEQDWMIRSKKDFKFDLSHYEKSE